MSENTDTVTLWASQELHWMIEVTREQALKFASEKRLYEQDYDSYEVHFDELLNTKYREHVTEWADEAETKWEDYDDIPDELMLEAADLWAKQMPTTELLRLIEDEGWMSDFVETLGVSLHPNDATDGTALEWEY